MNVKKNVLWCDFGTILPSLFSYCYTVGLQNNAFNQSIEKVFKMIQTYSFHQKFFFENGKKFKLNFEKKNIIICQTLLGAASYEANFDLNICAVVSVFLGTVADNSVWLETIPGLTKNACHTSLING